MSCLGRIRPVLAYYNKKQKNFLDITHFQMWGIYQDFN